MKKIAIIGDGGWGTALSIILSQKRISVSLWGFFKEYIESMSKTRENKKFLNGVQIPDAVRLTSSLEDAIAGADAIILAVPSEYFRGVLQNLKKIAPKDILYISATKGIESGTLLRMSETIKEALGGGTMVAAISGPSIAIEVARGLPTAIVAASTDINIARSAQDILISSALRVYASQDIIGVELGGALKNIIAIAAGVSDSMGLGTNTKSAILTRGLAEITRLGLAMGARQETFAGLSGLGDLITTCISPYSRNRWFGEMIGEGKSVNDIICRTEMVVEGVTTVKSAYELSKRHNVEMPITQEVYEIIYKNKPPKDVVKDLMQRDAKPEVY